MNYINKLKWNGALLLAIILLAGCTKYEFIDMGTSNGKHPCSMYDYLKSDTYNWSFTVEMINRAGLKDLFEGNDPHTKEFTFLGITNHSIRAYCYKKEWVKTVNGVTDADVSQIPVEMCRDFILGSIIPKRLMMDDISRGRRGENVPGKEGTFEKTLLGNTLWMYTFQEPYEEVPESGPVSIYIGSMDTQKIIRIASSNIETNNGVVHSLPYHYRLNDFVKGSDDDSDTDDEIDNDIDNNHNANSHE